VPFVDTADGAVEFRTYGEGEPVTLFAHGLSSSIDETRPLGRGVNGTRAFLHFRGHGKTTVASGAWTYADLGRDLRSVADRVDARRALGASLGAGALLNVLADTPERFERIVLFLPAVLDSLPDDAPFERLERMADAIDAGHAAALSAMLLADQPTAVREIPEVRDYWRIRARALSGSRVSQAIRTIPRSVPVADRSVLGVVTAPVLVVAQRDDTVHLASVAEEIAAAFPHAELHVFDAGAMWQAGAELRQLIAGFLND